MYSGCLIQHLPYPLSSHPPALESDFTNDGCIDFTVCCDTHRDDFGGCRDPDHCYVVHLIVRPR